MRQMLLMTTMATALLSLAAPLAAVAQPTHEIPLIDTSHPMDAAEVRYITGGIGEDERAEMEAQKADFNLYVTNASINGAFVEDAQVIVRKQNGKEWSEILSVTSGPLLFVQLEPGRYELDAVLGEQQKKQRIVISKKRPVARVHLGWKVPAMVAGE